MYLKWVKYSNKTFNWYKYNQPRRNKTCQEPYKRYWMAEPWRWGERNEAIYPILKENDTAQCQIIKHSKDQQQDHEDRGSHQLTIHYDNDYKTVQYCSYSTDSYSYYYVSLWDGSMSLMYNRVVSTDIMVWVIIQHRAIVYVFHYRAIMHTYSKLLCSKNQECAHGMYCRKEKMVNLVNATALPRYACSMNSQIQVEVETALIDSSW